MPLPTEITRRETPARDGSALDALIDFYRAFNTSDLEALAANWAEGDAPSMDNPSFPASTPDLTTLRSTSKMTAVDQPNMSTPFIAYIDRINASFAGLTMRGDLDMSAAAFGFATGTFFWGYFIFEVPGNVILEKVGARLWIARIMISWGIIAGLTALVTGTMTFTVVRFLLGAAEAGFFPGLLLYFTYWFPSHHHARIVSGFMIGLPIAVAAGAPTSVHRTLRGIKETNAAARTLV